MVDPRDEEPEGGDREDSNTESHGVERERPDGIHRLFLGDEAESPDRRGEQHEEVCSERSQAHAGRRYSPFQGRETRFRSLNREIGLVDEVWPESRRPSPPKIISRVDRVRL